MQNTFTPTKQQQFKQFVNDWGLVMAEIRMSNYCFGKKLNPDEYSKHFWLNDWSEEDKWFAWSQLKLLMEEKKGEKDGKVDYFKKHAWQKKLSSKQEKLL